MTRTVAIYQPRYFPKLHYLARARQSDAFVLLDDVEFSRRSPQHRAEIDFASKRWLTVPVRHDGETTIAEAEVDTSTRWPEKHARTLQHKYGQEAAVFQPTYEAVQTADEARLVDVTVPTLRTLFDEFGVDATVHRSSELAVEHPGDASAYLARLAAAVDADEYVAGERGYEAYLDEAPFAERGIEVVVQDWTPRWPDGNVCALDVLFGADDPAEQVAPG